jgi:hypothetical protein
MKNIILSSLTHRNIDRIKSLLDKYLKIMDLAYSITETSLNDCKNLEIFDPNSDNTNVLKIKIYDNSENKDEDEHDIEITESREWAYTLKDIATHFSKPIPRVIKRIVTFYNNKEKNRNEISEKYKPSL